MRGKKIGIIIIIIVLIIAILAGIITYLFLKTDVFLGKNQGFFRYLTQSIEQVENVANSKILENYKNLIDEETCETNTKIDFKYSEGGEVSSGYNNLNINMKTQKAEQYDYKNAQILFGDNSIVQVEGIQNDNLYGIRFTNIFNQFVTLLDGKNIDGLELTDENVELMKNIVEDNKDYYKSITFSKQEYEQLKNKYIQIFAEALNGGTFGKQNDAVITLNSQTIKTGAYSCQLTGLQVQNLILKILNNLKSDDIILDKVNNLLQNNTKYNDYITEVLRNAEDTEYPAIKIIVYVKNKDVVRTSISMNSDIVNIESVAENEKCSLNIKHEKLNSEKENQQTINISKSSTNEKESYNIEIKNIDGDDEYSINAVVDSDYKKTTLNLDFYKDIVNINVKSVNNISNTISDKVELNQSNNVVVNNLNDELLHVVVSKMKSAYADTLVKRYNLLIKVLRSENLMTALKNIITNDQLDDTTIKQPDSSNEGKVTKEEINRFNAKFEFYAGSEISGENVKVLIDVVKDNLESVNITQLETTSTSTNDKIKESIKLNIKKDNSNIDLANGIIEKIDTNEKYNVTIKYNESSELIESITIEPSKK